MSAEDSVDNGSNCYAVNGAPCNHTKPDSSKLYKCNCSKNNLLVPGSTSTMKRNKSEGNLIDLQIKETKVRVLYTGGTIGMIRNENNVLMPIPNALIKTIRKYPNMHDEEYAQKRFGSSAATAPLVLPLVQGEQRRVIYSITEYDPILDSSNMTIQDWEMIARDIYQSYEFFDGFVVLHGTDTLSYTASALSFMLEDLGKTVVITGSQIPIFETRTDGKDNFTSSLIVAGNYVIPEVCVLFGNKLMRGNRTIKVSSNALEAFDSPNVTPLARIGINVDVDYRQIFRPYSISRFCVHSALDDNVGVLRLFPSISSATCRAFLQPPMKGVVLQSFGAGNIPSNRADIIEELKSATDRGVIIVNCTQCPNGAVSGIYQTGQILYQLGVIPGYDMTPEAALTKLSYVLGKSDWDLKSKKQMMESNLRGELTNGRDSQMGEYDLVDAIARSMRLSVAQNTRQADITLFPAILNTAVLSGDLQKINNLKSYGADLSGVNQDNRTALHIACHEGKEDVVNLLLLNGVSIHIRDRHNRTPLMEAISTDNHAIIQLLMKCGAHLTDPGRVIGELLCSAASRGTCTRLESYRLAGADLFQPDPSGRTALHIAALHGHVELVKYLMKLTADNSQTDMLGLTALNYATRNCQTDIIEILQ